MRTDIIKKGEYGTLQVNGKFTSKDMGAVMYASFPVKTLFDWYPLNSHYTYKYSEKEDMFYLAVDTDGLLIPCYGLENNNTNGVKNKPSMGKSLRTGEPTWRNEEVYLHNQEVIGFATRLGIRSPYEDFTLKDVLDGLSVFQRALDAMYDEATTKYIQYDVKNSKDSLDKDSNTWYDGKEYYQYNPQDVKQITGKDEEARAELVLANLNQDELELYYKLGEVYTMLILMQKIAIARG